jgi:hypothetical protein
MKSTFSGSPEWPLYTDFTVLTVFIQTIKCFENDFFVAVVT